MLITLIEFAQRRRVLATLQLCLGAVFSLLLLGGPCVAAAPSNPWTIDQTVQSATNSNSYALWVKPGTTDANGNYSGDTVSIWTLDAGGNQIKISPTYGPFPGWRAYQLTPAFDGTLRLAWVKNTGTTVDTRQSVMSIWTLDVYANETAISPDYGPFTGWHFYEMYPNPDGTSALYWLNNHYDTNGDVDSEAVSIWRVDSVGSSLSVSPTYGPYSGWHMREGVPSFNKDGSSFLVWVNDGALDSNNNYSGDMIAVWKTDVQGNATTIGPNYGRYLNWGFSELYPAYDGTARLLWTQEGTYDSNYNYSGDTVSMWSMDSFGQFTSVSPTYGPYTGWTADSIIAAPSSTSRLLWIKAGTTDNNGNYLGDLASIWSLNAVGVQTSISPTYNIAGGTAAGLTVLSDGTERLEWDLGSSAASSYNDTRFSLWSLDASNNRTISPSPVYGPYY